MSLSYMVETLITLFEQDKVEDGQVRETSRRLGGGQVGVVTFSRKPFESVFRASGQCLG